jgi:hypothetical protein
LRRKIDKKHPSWTENKKALAEIALQARELTHFSQSVFVGFYKLFTTF